MTVSEKEIFDYLFHPENLDKEKMEFIKNDPLSKDLIKEYLSLQDFLDENKTEDSLKAKLASRIPLYKPQNKIELLPIQKFSKKLELFDTDEVKTSDASFFIDDAYKFFVKISKKIDHNQIFLFSSSTGIIKEYTLTFYPSNISVFRIDNLAPIVTDDPAEIGNVDKIELQIH